MSSDVCMSDNCEGQKSEENRVGSVQDGAVVGAAEENEMNGDIHTDPPTSAISTQGHRSAG